MKLDINREEFHRIFQMAAAVAPSRSPKAILQNIKLEALTNSRTLTMSATDTEVGVKLSVPNVEVIQGGSVVVPVIRLSSLLRESSDETLSIESEDNKTVVKGRSSKITLQGQSPDEFPEVADIAEDSSLELTAGVMRELIRRTIFAADTESTRYALGGILIELEGNKIHAVGTDGRRMASMTSSVVTHGKPLETNTNTIVPVKAMQLIERLLPDDEAAIHLSIRANDLKVKLPDGIFSTRLLEGRFPKWRDVIPKRSGGCRIELPVGPFFAALRQAAVVTSEDSRGIDFSFAAGTMSLSTTTREVGQSEVKMPISYDGSELEITLDHKFMADFLRVLQPEKMFTLEVENPETAALCFTDDDYQYVVMPLAKDRQ